MPRDIVNKNYGLIRGLGSVDTARRISAVLRLPNRTENEAEDGRHRERCHGLIFDGLVDGALQIAGNLLHLVAGFPSLLGYTAGEVLRLVSHVAKLVRGLIGDLLEL